MKTWGAALPIIKSLRQQRITTWKAEFPEPDCPSVKRAALWTGRVAGGCLALDIGLALMGLITRSDDRLLVLAVLMLFASFMIFGLAFVGLLAAKVWHERHAALRLWRREVTDDGVYAPIEQPVIEELGRLETYELDATEQRLRVQRAIVTAIFSSKTLGALLAAPAILAKIGVKTPTPEQWWALARAGAGSTIVMVGVLLFVLIFGTRVVRRSLDRDIAVVAAAANISRNRGGDFLARLRAQRTQAERAAIDHPGARLSLVPSPTRASLDDERDATSG